VIKPVDGAGGNDAALTPERWARVRSLVEEALTLAPEERSAFITASCGDDVALRDRVARLADSYERGAEDWGFLALPAGELAAPLLVADGVPVGDPAAFDDRLPEQFVAALADRYVVGAEVGRGGMATVYAADDVRHHRRVALKVLDPRLGALLGAERFLTEIQITAGLHQPNLVPLFDSGEAAGRLFYVMPFIEGPTLRARLQRERQLPVDEAVAIVRTIAGALDYAHRRGIVHRDLKPENILLHDGQPLVADFGISLAVSNAADARLTAIVRSLGTPQYMSPEQASLDTTVDARSDIYSLACILYELLVGEPPFIGGTVQAVIARVVGERPPNVRTLRPDVPANIDAAIARALSKLPADRHATAREFADALLLLPEAAGTNKRVSGARWRDPVRLLLIAAAIIGLASVGWVAFRSPAAPADITVIPLPNLIDQTQFGSVTITPDGRAIVFTGSAATGRPIMLWRLDQRAPRAVPGTEGGYGPFVSPDGRRIAFKSSARDQVETVSIDPVFASQAAGAWRYGNGAWVGDSVLVTEAGTGLNLVPTHGTPTLLTLPDSTRGEYKHRGPLVLPGGRAVIFTVSRLVGPGLVVGPLAIASLERSGASASPHVLLDVTARRAIAFVDESLLYTSADGKAIMAVRLDVQNRRTLGASVSVLRDDAGDLETAYLANNGTLLYLRRPRVNSVVVADARGAVRQPGVATPEAPFMNPRFSPDGRRFVVQVSSASGEDAWLYDIASRTGAPLTTSGQAMQPAWTPDGRRIVFLRGGFGGIMSQPIDGSAAAEKVVGTDSAFAPAVTPDGKNVVFNRRSASWAGSWVGSIWSAPLSGEGAPQKLIDDPFNQTMPAVSPDGHWLAYVSNRTGRNEIYARPFPLGDKYVQVSDSGGTEPAWSADGHRIYYRANGALMAAALTMPVLAVTSRERQFSDVSDNTMPHRNYDVSPDGTGFLMIAPSTAATPEAVIMLNWLIKLREQLARSVAKVGCAFVVMGCI
jgi:Tol biopolymer transport system component/tRNA A-37 threonylcarbamoyl transferase component Bud32